MRRIKTNVMLAIWLGIIIPVLLSFILYIVVIKGEIVNDKVQDFNTMSKAVEKILLITEQATFDQVQSIATRTQMRILLNEYINGIDDGHQEKIRTILFDALNSNDAFKRISIFQNNGVLVTTTSTSAHNTSHEINSNTNSIIVDYDEDDGIHMHGIVPLYYSDKKIGYVELITAPLYFESAIMDIFSDESSLEIFLAKENPDGSAQVITPLKYDGYLSGRTIENNLDRPVIKAFNDIQEPTAIDYRGKEVVIYTKYLPQHDLALVVKADKSDLLATVHVFEFWSTIQIIAAGGIVFFPAMIFSKRIVKPLRKIEEAAKNISKGDLNTRVNTSGSLEIESLANSINNMAKQLDKSKKQEIHEERLRIIGEISAKIAHDMRNPLSVLKNTTKILEIKKMPGIERYTSIYNDAIERLSHQVEDIMDYLRNKPLSLSTFELKSLLNICVSDVRFGGNIRCDVDCPILQIVGDKFKIRSAIVNILHNAKQAIGNNSGWIRILVIRTEPETVIKISNSGPNILEKHMQKIFEPLFTTKQRGTGLGLRSVQKILDEHNGSISVNNDPVTFTIRIPKILISQLEPKPLVQTQ